MNTRPEIALILVAPQLGENIGAAARVAKNFGITDLRLVNPRDGWPNPKAVEMSAGAKDVIESAHVYATTCEAIADLQKVWATSARARTMEKPIHTPHLAAQEMAQATATGVRVGVLFGCERSGLSNEDVACAQALISIPVSAEYGSLNLSQAVGIVAYEWFQSAHQPSEIHEKNEELATQDELQGWFDQLEDELDARGFWKVAAKKPIMWRNLRNVFQRSQLTSQEVRTLRGMLRALTDHPRRDDAA